MGEKKKPEKLVVNKKALRNALCEYRIPCNAKLVECTECAFFSNENFDKFIKQVGL